MSTPTRGTTTAGVVAGGAGVSLASVVVDAGMNWLVVKVFIPTAGTFDQDIQSMSWGGVSFARLTGLGTGVDDGNHGAVDVWMPTAALTPGTASLTFTANHGFSFYVIASARGGVNTTTPAGTPQVPSSTGSPLVATTASAVGDRVESIIAAENATVQPTLAANNGQTLDANNVSQVGTVQYSISAGSQTAAGASTTDGYTVSGVHDGVMISFALKGSSGTSITATAAGTSTVSVGLIRRRFTTPGTVAGISTATASLGRRRFESATAPGTSTASANVGAKRVVAVAATGTSTVAVTVSRAGKIIAPTAPGTSTASVSLGRVRFVAVGTVPGTSTVTVQFFAQLVAAGTSTVATTLSAKRVVASTAHGLSTVTVGLTKTGSTLVGSPTAHGLSTATANLTAIRRVASTAAGFSTVAVSLGRIRFLAVPTVAGLSSASVTMSARRGISVSVAGQSSINLTANARRAITVSIAGQAAVSASLGPSVIAATLAPGKYAAEHASALADLAAAGS